MPGPPPKHPGTRQRRNRTSTAATLSVVHDVEEPALPTRLWHEQTRSWWRDIWASPMAPEWDDSDVHGLFNLALLVDDFWTTDDPKLRKELAAEIRQQRQGFGLTPIDRRRLQWEIERTDEAQDRGRRRRAAVPASPPKPAAEDPRAVLRSV
ncbi:hypothetical protein [Actinoplanes sp. NPDC051851]|uniref:phage terminase small subunit n=1 Tax=Actinoplanes sp. NPDC051851 TaxID=3154753 RepID=UPI00343DBB03